MMGSFRKFTWHFEGEFCSAKFIEQTGRDHLCEACRGKLPAGSSVWQCWVAGNGTYSICEPCWEHRDYCETCNEEGTEWHVIGDCRKESEPKPKENENDRT